MNKKSNYKYKNLKEAQARKRKRLFYRILTMLKESEKSKDLYFLTFTFTDDVLKNTSQKTRIRYIKQFLLEQTSQYILNCDYGKTTEREHYHAIAKAKYHYIVYTLYRYGNIKGEPINKLKRFTRANKSLEEIAESLTAHATKNTTKDTKIIYSRTQTTTKANEGYINYIAEQLKTKHFKIKE